MTTTDRTKFLADRRLGIGGSDVAAIVGLDPRVTKLQLYLDKASALYGTSEATPAMRRGNFLEAAAVRRYAEMTKPTKLEPARQVVADWRRGNLDAAAVFGDAKRTVEVKTLSRRVWADGWGEEWTDHVPDRVLCQSLWYANLDESDGIDIVAVVMPDDPDEVLGLTADEVLKISKVLFYQVERAPKTEADLIAAAEEFWHGNVLKRIPPDPTEGTGDVELRWPVSATEKGKPMTPEILELVSTYHRIGEQNKALEEQRKRMREQILIFAEDAQYLLAPDGSPWLSMKTSPRAGYVVEPTTTRPVLFTRWWNKAHKVGP